MTSNTAADTGPARITPVSSAPDRAGIVAGKLWLLVATMPAAHVALAAVAITFIGVAPWGWAFFAVLAVGYWLARYGRALSNAEVLSSATAERARVDAKLEREKSECRTTLARLQKPSLPQTRFGRN